MCVCVCECVRERVCVCVCLLIELRSKLYVCFLFFSFFSPSHILVLQEKVLEACAREKIVSTG